MRPSYFWQRFIRNLFSSTPRTIRRPHKSRRPLQFESLEARDVPSITVTTFADGLVADRNFDGTYDATDTTNVQVSDRLFSPSFASNIGQERPVMEFDLSNLGLAAGTEITSAKLEFRVVSFTTSSAAPHFQISAYADDGSITTADGNAAATLVGSGTITALGTVDVTLDAADINALVGGTAAIRIENTILNGEWFSFASREFTSFTPAQLILETGSVSPPPPVSPPPVPPLTLTVSPNSVSESAGLGASTGTVTRSGDLSQALTLHLTSSDPSAATVPDTVTIAAGQASATFAINAIDDQILDDPKIVTISASGTTANIPVGLDTAFSSGGLATTPLGTFIQFPHASIARQADGKILAASEAGGGSWQLARFNADGTLDTSFGSNGVAITSLPYQFGSNPVPYAIVVQSDGKILVGGTYGSYTQEMGILVRYNTNGSLDTTFGSSGIANLSAAPNDIVTDIAVRPDGRILLGLEENGSVFSRVVQLNANGTLDTSFGNGGVASLNLGYSAEQLVILSNGEFLVGGSFQSTAGVAEVLANGQGLDTTFGTAGKATLVFGTGSVGIADLALDSQGRIVYGGTVGNDYAVGRLTSTGAVDSTFGTNGTTELSVAGGTDLATSMALQPDDKIVLGGVTIVNGVYDSSLVRFNADGSPDTTFNSTGGFRQSLVNKYSADLIYGINLLPNGQLMALTGWADAVRLARFNMADPQTIQASDQLDVTESDVNLAPVVGNQSFTVDENSAVGTTVGTVVASDPNPGQTLSYAITNGNTGGVFSIDASTGAITVANTATLNFETNPVFVLNVRVTDNYKTSLSTDAAITINLNNVNESPTVTPATYSLPENTANGTVVGTVTASDPDAGESLTYSITAGNTGGAFAINSTGKITVVNTTALDFETNPVFVLTVQATDNGSPALSGTAKITVNLTNVNEVPVVAPTTFHLPENTANGTVVGTVTATDPDAGQTLTYSITAGNTGGAFAINSATGVVTVANSAAIDFETNPVFTLTVRATDNGTPVLNGSATATVDLTNVNEKPVITPAIFNLPEHSANGTAVGTVKATDPDAGQRLTFAITGGNTSGAFAINSSTGAITVANSAALNYATMPVFTLTVQATDNGGPALSNSAKVTINLTQVLQNLPVNIQVLTNGGNIVLGQTKTVQLVIFSTSTFDARTIDVHSLRFGHTGTEQSLVSDHRGRIEFAYQDVNHDGHLDLVVQIDVSKAGFVVGDTHAYLTGSLINGEQIDGTDDVTVTKKRRGHGGNGR